MKGLFIWKYINVRSSRPISSRLWKDSLSSFLLQAMNSLVLFLFGKLCQEVKTMYIN